VQIRIAKRGPMHLGWICSLCLMGSNDGMLRMIGWAMDHRQSRSVDSRQNVTVCHWIDDIYDISSACREYEHIAQSVHLLN
jgi:hypothetical protein